MDLIFIRHGHYGGKAYPTRAEKKAAPLSARGVEDARATGMYLAEHGLRPDVVLHTSSRRTRQTAAVVLEELGMAGHPVIDIGSSFRSLEGLAAKLKKWGALHGFGHGSVVFLVGHGGGQGVLRKCFRDGAPPPKASEDYAAALCLYVPRDGPPEARGFFCGAPK